MTCPPRTRLRGARRPEPERRAAGQLSALLRGVRRESARRVPPHRHGHGAGAGYRRSRRRGMCVSRPDSIICTASVPLTLVPDVAHGASIRISEKRLFVGLPRPARLEYRAHPAGSVGQFDDRNVAVLLHVESLVGRFETFGLDLFVSCRASWLVSVDRNGRCRPWISKVPSQSGNACHTGKEPLAIRARAVRRTISRHARSPTSCRDDPWRFSGGILRRTHGRRVSGRPQSWRRRFRQPASSRKKTRVGHTSSGLPADRPSDGIGAIHIAPWLGGCGRGLRRSCRHVGSLRGCAP